MNASRLTDEQLREWRDGKVDLYREQSVYLATELLASRAKLAVIGKALNEYAHHPVIIRITTEIAGAMDKPRVE